MSEVIMRLVLSVLADVINHFDGSDDKSSAERVSGNVNDLIDLLETHLDRWVDSSTEGRETSRGNQ